MENSESVSNNVDKLDALDIRIPKWNKNDLMQRACSICGNPNTVLMFYRPDDLSANKCRDCGCVTVSPSPSNKQLDDFYLEYHENHFSGLSSAEDIKETLRSIHPLQDRRIAWLNSHNPVNGLEILDVGCGKGQFLHQLNKLGATTHGVEFDPSAAAIALQLDASTVHVGAIETMRGDCLFDVITLNDIIEHPFDPMSLLYQCIDRLKPGGIILIWTPNGDNIRNDSSPVCLQVDLEHMQYISTDTISYIANKTGLKIRHLETMGHPSLERIKMNASARSQKVKVTSKIKKIPGLRITHKLINSVRSTFRNPGDSGNYHLFACLEK